MTRIFIDTDDAENYEDIESELELRLITLILITIMVAV